MMTEQKEQTGMEHEMRECVSEAECKNSGIMVSICCITYNQVSYIRDALEGFVNQETDFAYEVLIHDDASTDGTADIGSTQHVIRTAFFQSCRQKTSTPKDLPM
jgi:hypothetical protein